MLVNVLLFAAARDVVGSDCVAVEVDDDATSQDVLVRLAELSPEMKQLVPSCRLAIDNRYAESTAAVRDSFELALIPPVSGG